MSQFYIGEEDVSRCQESQHARLTITIIGVNFEGNVQAFTGTVQSMEHDAKRNPGRQWRVTMRDSKPAITGL